MNENKQMQQQLVGKLEELKDADLDTVVGGFLTLGFGVEAEGEVDTTAVTDAVTGVLTLPTTLLETVVGLVPPLPV